MFLSTFKFISCLVLGTFALYLIEAKNKESRVSGRGAQSSLKTAKLYFIIAIKGYWLSVTNSLTIKVTYMLYLLTIFFCGLCTN